MSVLSILEDMSNTACFNNGFELMVSFQKPEIKSAFLENDQRILSRLHLSECQVVYEVSVFEVKVLPNLTYKAI